MQATTPTGSRAATPKAMPPGPSRGATGRVGAQRSPARRTRSSRSATAPTCCDSATGRTRAGLGDGEIDQAGRRLAEACRRFAQTRAALGARHARPRSLLERRARGTGRLAHLVRRRLGRATGDLLGCRVDHRIGPAGRRHPAAADQDLAEGRLRHVLDVPGRRYAACAARAASRCRVVLCIGSRSKRGSTCFPKVSIERRTCFWSRVRVSGA